MAKEKDPICINPEERICPQYDAVSIRKSHAPSKKDMGVTVQDNCAEEHIM